MTIGDVASAPASIMAATTGAIESGRTSAVQTNSMTVARGNDFGGGVVERSAAETLV
jgi:hypothetical protein